MRSLGLIGRVTGLLLVFAVGVAQAGVFLIPDVPSYEWYGGCAPTAGGMIVGYWDAHGFPDLITEGDGTNSWTTNQAAIKEMIASQGYFEDWWPKPDAPPPHHPDDCLADFMQTSRGDLDPGWTNAGLVDDGLEAYAAYKGYTEAESDYVWFNHLWPVLVDEVGSGRPMALFVDQDGDGGADHFVAAIGYDDTPGALRYAAYNTYDHVVHWFDFVPTTAHQPYSVATGTWFHAPEPATLGLAGAGAVAILWWGRRRKTPA